MSSWNTVSAREQELLEEVDTIVGSTTLEQFGRLLLKIGKQEIVLEMPTALGDYFGLYDVSNEESVSDHEILENVCDAITKLRATLKRLVVYKGNSSRIQALYDQIARLQDELDELEEED